MARGMWIDTPVMSLMGISCRESSIHNGIYGECGHCPKPAVTAAEILPGTSITWKTSVATFTTPLTPPKGVPPRYQPAGAEGQHAFG